MRVPQYAPGQVGPVQTTNARIQAFDHGDGIGGALEGLGNEVSAYSKMQDGLNDENDKTQARKIIAQVGVRVTETLAEYETRQAGAARESQSDYQERIDQAGAEALETAANPRMRKYIEEGLLPLAAQAQGKIASHSIAQQRVEKKQGFEALSASTFQRGMAERNPAARDVIKAELISIALDRAIEMEGLDPETNPAGVDIVVLAETTKFHNGVLDQMFARVDPNLDEIASYQLAFEDEMTAELAVATMGRMQAPLQGRQAELDADAAMALAAPASALPDAAPAAAGPVGGRSSDRLDSVTSSVESNNRRYGKDGQLIRSPVGAMGEMQVMPETAKDPGFGIRPWDGKGADDLARVGKQYRAAMEREFNGDLSKMWAAYNMGPNGLKAVIRKHGDNWLAHVPQETRDYVSKTAAQLGGQQPAYAPEAREWDRSGTYRSIESLAAQENWTPERKQRALSAVDKRIARDEGMKREIEQEAGDAADEYVAGLGDGFRSTTQIPKEIWDGLTNVQKARYKGIADAINAPVAAKANGDTAVTLNRMAGEAFRTEAGRKAFIGQNLELLRPQLTPAEYETLILAQDKLKAAPPVAGRDYRKGIEYEINAQKKFGGYDLPDNEEGLRARNFMFDYVSEIAKTRVPQNADYAAAFNQATRTVPTQKSFLGFETGKGSKPATRVLSTAYREQIRRNFRQAHGRQPTEAEIQQWFDNPMGR